MLVALIVRWAEGGASQVMLAEGLRSGLRHAAGNEACCWRADGRCNSMLSLVMLASAGVRREAHVMASREAHVMAS